VGITLVYSTSRVNHCKELMIYHRIQKTTMSKAEPSIIKINTSYFMNLDTNFNNKF